MSFSLYPQFLPFNIPLPLPFPLLIALIPFALLSLRRIYLQLKPASTHNGVPRPPFVADWIPFLGNALGMTRGDIFWKEAVDKHGPMFRVSAMGEERTFVTSPQLINYVYKNSKNFDFYFFRRNMQSVIFGMNYDNSQSDAMDAEIFPQHHRDMQPGSIKSLIQRYADLLEEGMQEKVKDMHAGSSMQVDLCEFAFDILYEASAKAFFSPSFPHARFKAPFLAFDTAFPLLNLSRLPLFARRPAERAREKALDVLSEWWSTCTAEDKQMIAPSVMGMIETGEKEGWSERDLASLMLSEIWALEANAPYAGIWAVAQLIRTPAIFARVQAEIASTISALSPPTLSTLLHLPQPDLPRILPLTNAVFQETLRYHVDTLSLRVVQADCVIPPDLISASTGTGTGAEKSHHKVTALSTSTGLALKAGEQCVCVTRVPVWDKEEWGQDAHTWNPDRFLGEGKVSGRTMNPFGGGVSMCEGRHFASAEILTFIAVFSHTFSTAQIVSDSLVASTQRPGLGVQQPKGKMVVRLTKRET